MQARDRAVVCDVATRAGERDSEVGGQPQAGVPALPRGAAGDAAAKTQAITLVLHLSGISIVPVAQQKAMVLAAGIDVGPHDVTASVDPLGESGESGRDINRSEFASAQQKAMYAPII